MYRRNRRHLRHTHEAMCDSKLEMWPPLRAEPSCPNPSESVVLWKSATPTAGESQEVHPKAPVKHQEPASLSPRVVTTQSGQVIKPLVCFVDCQSLTVYGRKSMDRTSHKLCTVKSKRTGLVTSLVYFIYFIFSLHRTVTQR